MSVCWDSSDKLKLSESIYVSALYLNDRNLLLKLSSCVFASSLQVKELVTILPGIVPQEDRSGHAFLRLSDDQNVGKAGVKTTEAAYAETILISSIVIFQDTHLFVFSVGHEEASSSFDGVCIGNELDERNFT